MIDSRIEIGSLSIANSQNFKGSIIYWDKDKFESWLLIGWSGLTFCHHSDPVMDPHVKHPNQIYNIIGVDSI